MAEPKWGWDAACGWAWTRSRDGERARLLSRAALLVAAATRWGGDANPPHQQLQDLARRKLPEVEKLIARAKRVRGWLQTATSCGCNSLDVCALFAHDDRLTPDGLHLVTVNPMPAA